MGKKAKELLRLFPQRELALTVHEGHTVISDIQGGNPREVTALRPDKSYKLLEALDLILSVDSHVITAIDIHSGGVLWRFPFAFNQEPQISTSELTVAVGAGNSLMVLDRKTGRLVWEREFGDKVDNTQISHGLLLCKIGKKRLAILDETDGSTVLDRRILSGGTILYADDEIAILTYLDWNAAYRRVEAIDLVSGDSIWLVRRIASAMPQFSPSLLAVHVPVGSREEYHDDSNSHFGGITGKQNSVIRIGAHTGRITDTKNISAGISSILPADAGLYVGTERGEISIIFSEQHRASLEKFTSRHSIKITTDPQSASFALCGKDAGSSPALLEDLVPGIYEMSVSAGGRLSMNKTVRIFGNSSLHVELRPGLKIQTDSVREVPAGEVPASVWRMDDVQIQHSVGEESISVFDLESHELLWDMSRIIGPVRVVGGLLVYSVGWDFQDTEVTYLVAHPLWSLTTGFHRIPLHLWRGERIDKILVGGTAIYVADEKNLYAYDTISGRRMWSAISDNNIDAIFGIIAGTVVTAEGRDIVCRDYRNGAETLRFPAVFGPHEEIPNFTIKNGSIAFASGLTLIIDKSF